MTRAKSFPSHFHGELFLCIGSGTYRCLYSSVNGPTTYWSYISLIFSELITSAKREEQKNRSRIAIFIRKKSVTEKIFSMQSYFNSYETVLIFLDLYWSLD